MSTEIASSGTDPVSGPDGSLPPAEPDAQRSEPDGSPPRAEPAAPKPRIRAVSLGSWCAVRGHLQELDLKRESYPFDNMRVSCAGVIHFLDTRFADFLTYERVSVPAQNVNRKVYHGRYHSFYHDDLEDPADRTKYERRISRFLSLGESGDSLLFLFACNSSRELRSGERLLRRLRGLFGEQQVWLLMLVDGAGGLAGGMARERGFELEGTDGRLLVHLTDEQGRFVTGISFGVGRASSAPDKPSATPIQTLSIPMQEYSGGDPRKEQYHFQTGNIAWCNYGAKGPQLWEVVGGGDAGGIVVRMEKELGSAMLGRLATGARVKRTEQKDGRFHYEKVSGDGPDFGWVSVNLNGRVLVTKI